jgi:predicted SprT family Zn-dependent metalloprotease
MGFAAAVNPPSASDRAWAAWDRDIKAECPTHHVEWLYGAAYQPLYEDFDATLKPVERKRVERFAKVDEACADSTVGHSCQLGRHLAAYRSLGLGKKFTQYTCRHVACEEGALCSRAPGQ